MCYDVTNYEPSLNWQGEIRGSVVPGMRDWKNVIHTISNAAGALFKNDEFTAWEIQTNLRQFWRQEVLVVKVLAVPADITLARSRLVTRRLLCTHCGSTGLTEHLSFQCSAASCGYITSSVEGRVSGSATRGQVWLAL